MLGYIDQVIVMAVKTMSRIRLQWSTLIFLLYSIIEYEIKLRKVCWQMKHVSSSFHRHLKVVNDMLNWYNAKLILS